MTDFPNLQVKDPELMKNLEIQLNTLTTEIAHTNFSENKEACQEFFDLIMEFKDQNQRHFSHETMKRVGNDLSMFIRHQDNQIAQGIVEHLRQEAIDRNPEDYEKSLTSMDKPDTVKGVRYVCKSCDNSWKTLEYLKEFQDQGLIEEGEEWERLQETVILNYWRSKDYPNDFSPISQNCPVCNNSLSVDREEMAGDLEAVKIEKEKEASDYESKLSKIAPHGWEEVDLK
jgi:hypothetical protein